MPAAGSGVGSPRIFLQSLSLQMAYCPPPSHTTPRRTRTDHSAHPVLSHESAQVTCKPPCPASFPGLSVAGSRSPSPYSPMPFGSKNCRRRDLRQPEIENLGVPTLG